VKWERIGKPKKWGGWAIKDLNKFAMDHAAKLRWQILTLDNLHK